MIFHVSTVKFETDKVYDELNNTSGDFRFTKSLYVYGTTGSFSNNKTVSYTFDTNFIGFLFIGNTGTNVSLYCIIYNRLYSIGVTEIKNPWSVTITISGTNTIVMTRSDYANIFGHLLGARF